ncbi:MAG: hypothetical protein ACSHW1_17350, partial [Yoonia sp.]|uniref:hypothetical protein n=1 Tax=Yoonia sp. TaxID=2212373 RepID=UPI003EF4A2D4
HISPPPLYKSRHNAIYEDKRDEYEFGHRNCLKPPHDWTGDALIVRVIIFAALEPAGAVRCGMHAFAPRTPVIVIPKDRF